MRRVTLLLALTLCVAGWTGQAHAGTTGTIAVTVSLQEEISVSLDASAWNIGPIALSGTNPLPTVTATNDGNVTVDLAIRGANGAGGWFIGSPAAADTFEVSLGSPAITLGTGDTSLASSVAKGGTVSIDMTYSAPTSDTLGGGVDQGFNITVTASKTL